MKIYMAVTADEYELPVAIADSPAELAEIYGMTKGTLLSSITRNVKRQGVNVRFVRMKIEDD